MKLKTLVESKIPHNKMFEISNVKSSFIYNQLHGLKCNKASGIDELSAKYLKITGISAPVISQPLALILNLSIHNGEYPDALKHAKGTPVFKKGEKSSVNNYWPISVLPLISSIFERHINNCLIDSLEKHKESSIV